ncbi:MAG: hypothetical protein JHC87_01790 [Thermoleophilaceae bacterium]|nr:hypothetical protein [Thermoleophilaceae bacterium]
MLAVALAIASPGVAEDTTHAGPTIVVGEPRLVTCADKFVRAAQYNKLLRRQRDLVGSSPHLRLVPVTHCAYFRRKQLVRKYRSNCRAHAQRFGASWYGGSGDSGTPGSTGASGVNLNGHMAFAELNMGRAMGGLPMFTWRYLHHGNHTIHAQKLDIGAGGGPVNGFPRAIDLWHQTAAALHMGNGVVVVTKLPCRSVFK